VKTWATAPRLPNGISRLSFNVCYRGRNICVTATPGEARYELHGGEPMTILHYGQEATVSAADPVKLPIPALPARPRPQQPRGRAPLRRRPPG
jgi:alpha,alpha-trehalose phosphorylase